MNFFPINFVSASNFAAEKCFFIEANQPDQVSQINPSIFFEILFNLIPRQSPQQQPSPAEAAELDNNILILNEVPAEHNKYTASFKSHLPAEPFLAKPSQRSMLEDFKPANQETDQDFSHSLKETVVSRFQTFSAQLKNLLEDSKKVSELLENYDLKDSVKSSFDISVTGKNPLNLPRLENAGTKISSKVEQFSKVELPTPEGSILLDDAGSFGASATIMPLRLAQNLEAQNLKGESWGLSATTLEGNACLENNPEHGFNQDTNQPKATPYPAEMFENSQPNEPRHLLTYEQNGCCSPTEQGSLLHSIKEKINQFVSSNQARLVINLEIANEPISIALVLNKGRIKLNIRTKDQNLEARLAKGIKELKDFLGSKGLVLEQLILNDTKIRGQEEKFSKSNLVQFLQDNC